MTALDHQPWQAQVNPPARPLSRSSIRDNLDQRRASVSLGLFADYEAQIRRHD